MRLQAFLHEKQWSYRHLASLRDPAASYSAVRQWALGLRFPKNPDDLAWLTMVTDGRVTANDIADHVREVRAAALAAGKSPRAFVAEQRRVAA